MGRQKGQEAAVAFFTPGEWHAIAQQPQDQRARAAAGLLTLGIQGLLVLLFLAGIIHEAGVVVSHTAPTVMVSIEKGTGRTASHDASEAPAVRQMHVAPITVKEPEITIQPEPRPAPVPAPTNTATPPVTNAPAPTNQPATSLATAADSTNAAQSGGGGGNGGGVGAAAASGAGGGGGAGGYDINPYLARVAAYIQSHLHNMVISSGAVLDHDIKPVVHLVWRRDGTVEKVEIYRSSNLTAPDKEAVAAVIRSQPLPPFPQDMPGERVNGLIPILFFTKKS